MNDGVMSQAEIDELMKEAAAAPAPAAPPLQSVMEAPPNEAPPTAVSIVSFAEAAVSAPAAEAAVPTVAAVTPKAAMPNTAALAPDPHAMPAGAAASDRDADKLVRRVEEFERALGAASAERARLFSLTAHLEERLRKMESCFVELRANGGPRVRRPDPIWSLAVNERIRVAASAKWRIIEEPREASGAGDIAVA